MNGAINRCSKSTVGYLHCDLQLLLQRLLAHEAIAYSFLCSQFYFLVYEFQRDRGWGLRRVFLSIMYHLLLLSYWHSVCKQVVHVTRFQFFSSRFLRGVGVVISKLPIPLSVCQMLRVHRVSIEWHSMNTQWTLDPGGNGMTAIVHFTAKLHAKV